MSLIGQILQDRYYIISAIGEGGMGRVYYAEDKRLNQKVAIKETIAKSSESSQEIDARIKSFQREAHLLAGKIKHPAVPKVIDYFQFEENWYIVMEYIDGDSLEKQRKERNQPFFVKEVLLLTDQLLQILDLLHNQDPPIIHRDIKPSNIKVKNDHVYLLDFGLAKQITGSSSTFATFMTPAFASPEQINNKEVTQKSDLYSVGATMYFLLTNDEPASAFERSLAIASGSVDPLQNIKKLRLDLPDEIANLIMSALSIKTEERPHSAKMMRLKINDFLTEKDKTLPLLSILAPTQPSIPGVNIIQPESEDADSKEKTEIPLQSSDQFLTNQSVSEANLIQFESKDSNSKEKVDIPSAPSYQFSASQSPIKSNLNSNDATQPQTIKQSNRNWLKAVAALGLLIVIVVTGFGLYRNKERISASWFPTPTPAPTPEPTPNPRDVAIQLTDEAIEELFNNNFDEAERKAKLAVETD
jgi:serine/threonine protein kinase